ncbi:MAG: c-type cytochrome, partial [Gemmataceae bacterium]|nr:c-type cytochrome [Gemmataceae bacterium]
ADVRLDALRHLQRKLGGPPAPSARGTVWEGYSRSGTDPVPDAVRADLRKAFPSGDDLLDFELARTLAMIEDDSPTVLKAMEEKLELPFWMPYHHIHYLACFARLPGKRTKGMTEAATRCLLGLDEAFKPRESNWPLRIAEIHALLAQRDPVLNAALLASADFGRAPHAVFTRAKGFDRARAADRFLAKAREGFVWDAELVRLVAELPVERSMPVLRKLWGRVGLDEEIVLHLARHPRAEDHPRLLIGLGSARLAVVENALAGLEKLEAQEKPEAEALIMAMRQLPVEKATAALRARLLARLEKATGNKEKTLDDWAIWAAEKWPALARKLVSPDGVDEYAWKKRLEKVAWKKGDAKRGAAVFAKASCASCHSGASALGPDLAGVAGRFSRADLMTAIIRPSKDVPARYRTTRITTERGLAHDGIIVYEAFDGIILQTGPGTTIRLAGKRIASKRLLAQSLMPTGLLDRLADGEIADLYAFLRSP